MPAASVGVGVNGVGPLGAQGIVVVARSIIDAVADGKDCGGVALGAAQQAIPLFFRRGGPLGARPFLEMAELFLCGGIVFGDDLQLLNVGDHLCQVAVAQPVQDGEAKIGNDMIAETGRVSSVSRTCRCPSPVRPDA